MSTANVVLVKTELHAIAQHGLNIAMGLQNIAPAQVPTGASIQYLKEISIELESTVKKINEL